LINTLIFLVITLLSYKLLYKFNYLIWNYKHYILTLGLILVIINKLIKLRNKQRYLKDIKSINETEYCYINRRTKEIINPVEFIKILKRYKVLSTHNFFYFPYEKQWTLSNGERIILINRLLL